MRPCLGKGERSPSRELVQGVLKGGGVAPELSQLILDRSAGNPLFMEEGQRLAQDLKDSKAQLCFQTNMGLYYLISGGDSKKGRKYIEKSLEESELTEEVEVIVSATTEMMNSHIIEGNYSRVRLLAPKVIALMEKTRTEHELFGRTENAYSMLSGYCGMSLGATGRFPEAARLLEQGLSFARDMNNLLSIGMFYWFKGDVESQTEHYKRSSVSSSNSALIGIFSPPSSPDRVIQDVSGVRIHVKTKDGCAVIWFVPSQFD